MRFEDLTKKTYDELKEADYTPDVIFCGDSSSLMPHIPHHSIDLILTDPPYGLTQAVWDIDGHHDRFWNLCENILKPEGLLVLTAQQPFVTELFETHKAVNCSIKFKYDLIWLKNKVTGHLNSKRMPLRNHEHILVFGRTAGTYNPQMTKGHEPLHYAVNRGKTELYGKFDSVESRTGATDRYPKSVLEFDVVNNSQRIHPTQKPVELFSYLINTYSNEGDVVFDPYAGSLTTAVACAATKRRYICIEQSMDFIKDGLQRFQGGIFDL